ncbi:MAG: RNA methyltransferase [Alcanivoracaceae bacterium]|nr:RNA methyltransferase [Alcanivoracaceae bacterium]
MSEKKEKSPLRKRADEIKPYVCKNVIVVLENPADWKNVGMVIRNVNAIGAEKVYVVDEARQMPESWQDMRAHKTLFKASASAVKWTFVKRFDDTGSCLQHLQKNNFRSVATSPHIKGKKNASVEVANFTKYKKLAMWFGNESDGISDLAIESCDLCVSIPMHGIIESFNLAVSTGIVLYEVTKQRRAFEASRRRTIPT